MAKEQDLIIKIKAQADQATKDITKLTTKIEKLTKTTKKIPNNKVFDGMTKDFSGLAKGIAGVVAGFSALAVGMKAVEFVNMAKDAEQASDSFKTIFEDLGLNAETEFNKIKEASKGLIDEQSLKQSAVTAVSLGVPIEKLTELMEIARVKAKVMGTDTKSAFNDLAIGIGRGSPMILDNLGLTIKLEEANIAYAESIGKTVAELSKKEKQLALTNAVIKASEADMQRFGDSELNANEASQALTASIADLKVKIGLELLPHMLKLTKATNEWVKSIEQDGVARWIGRLEKIAQLMVKIDDYLMPDFFTGEEDAGFLGNTVLALENVSDIINIIEDTYDSLFNAQEKIIDQQTGIDALSDAVKKYGGSAESLKGLKEQTLAMIEANKKMIAEWKASDSTVYKFQGQIKEAEDQLHLMLDVLEEIVKAEDPFKKLADEAKKATTEVENATKSVEDYSEENIRTVGEYYKERLALSKASMKTLEADEKKLVKEIEKAHKDLAKALEGISKERFASELSLADKIREAGQLGLSDVKKFADDRLRAEEKLALATQALANNRLEQYRTYIKQYEALAIKSAGTELRSGELVTAGAKKEQQTRLSIYKIISDKQNEYFNLKTSNATTAHDLTVAQAKAELEGNKASIEAMKVMIDLMKTFVEATTGKKITLDTSDLDSAVAKMRASEILVDSLGRRQTLIAVDSTQIDQGKQKLEELRELTINGVTVEVDAKTDPASFDIDKMIVKESKKNIEMGVNPEWEKAEIILADFREEEKNKPIEPEIDLQIDKSKEMMDELRAYIAIPSKHTVDPNTDKAQGAIDKLKINTSSTHTVYIRYSGGSVPTTSRSEGGVVPQHLAVGGTFTGSGRVAGYDSTDSDKVNAFLTGGEFVIKRKAVDLYGLSFLNAINSMRMPKPQGYADGGIVSGGSSSGSQLRPLQLNIGGNSFGALIPSEVASALQIFIDEQGGL